MTVRVVWKRNAPRKNGGWWCEELAADDGNPVGEVDLGSNVWLDARNALYDRYGQDVTIIDAEGNVIG